MTWYNFILMGATKKSKKSATKTVKKSRSSKQKLFEEYVTVGRQKDRCVTIYKEMVAKHMDLQTGDLACLDLIHERGRACADDLMKVTGLTSGAVTGVIHRLTEKGYITHRRSSHDKRRVVVEPVAKKIDLYIHYYKPIGEKIFKLIDTYTDKELSFLNRYNEKVCKIFEEEIEKLNHTKK